MNFLKSKIFFSKLFKKKHEEMINNADITVIMPTYNKEMYISEALDSILTQKTSYKYHILITDDCSSDNTLNIVKKYIETYPDKITLLPSKKNQKLYKNIIKAYQIVKTKYFCVLDPDDYWTDEFKIQKALDFLENHENFTIYMTAVDMLTKEGEIKPFIKGDKILDFTFDDYLNGREFILGCTLSSIFRNVIFSEGVPYKMLHLNSNTYKTSFRGDTFRSFIHLEKGKAHFVPEVTGMYRITDQGIWQSLSNANRFLLNANLFKDLWLYFNGKYLSFLLFSQIKFYDYMKNYSLYDFVVNTPNTYQQLLAIKQLTNLRKLYDTNIPK